MSPSEPDRPERLGSEVPRLFTSPLRELTPETSLGFSVITFAEQVLGIWLFPWQRWLLIHALELRPDGSLRFRNVVVLVARQNGKSTLSQVLSLWWMYVCGVRLVLGTAQDLDTAEEVWQGAVDLVQEEDDDANPIRPDLAERVRRVVQVNGKKSLDLVTKERYKIKAANRRAGRGLSGDRIILDELREHLNWLAWAAITKTTMARPNAQIWCFSNAGDMTSVVLVYLRKLAHRALGDPDGICSADDEGFNHEPSEADLEDLAEWDSELDDLEVTDLEVEEDDLFLAEWSATPGCDRTDRDEWCWANPSLNHRLPDGSQTLTERTVASACRTDPEWVFRTEVLCQWAEGTLTGPFPAGAWDAVAVPRQDGKIPAAERIVGRTVAAVEVAIDRSRSYVAVAGKRRDGVPQVEIAARSTGSDWVVDWFADSEFPHRARWQIVVRPDSPASALVDDLRDAGLDVVEWAGRDLGVAWADLYDAVLASTVRHTSQPVLNLPAATAVLRVNEKGVTFIDFRGSPHDSAPLAAVCGALWRLKQLDAPAKPQVKPRPVRRSVSAVHQMARAGF